MRSVVMRYEDVSNNVALVYISITCGLLQKRGAGRRGGATYTFATLSECTLIASILLFALLSLNTNAFLSGC